MLTFFHYYFTSQLIFMFLGVVVVLDFKPSSVYVHVRQTLNHLLYIPASTF